MESLFNALGAPRSNLDTDCLATSKLPDLYISRFLHVVYGG